ncbi:MAG: hypothetical protein ACOY5C_01790 [Pseudomonadota bacterium]|uniref:hypothetical protein n=1 Tax=Thermithiobacillus tepidarius TaxID=929 RepID=UPI00048AC74C|nr:hypothetical protein [Thermithiobacillus tepidarius]
MNRSRMEELLYQVLEVEIGGQKIYETALRCVQNEDLRQEWQKYLEETRRHEQIVRDVFFNLGLDPERETAGRRIQRAMAESLVKSMEMALEAGDPMQAQLVAAEAVLHGEMKDHQNWTLVGNLMKKLDDPEGKVLRDAHDRVEDDEDRHFYHTKGWARELWMESLGLDAVLPPPEEKMDVKTAFGQASAESSRKLM